MYRAEASSRLDSLPKIWSGTKRSRSPADTPPTTLLNNTLSLHWEQFHFSSVGLVEETAKETAQAPAKRPAF